jgi:hypothetical protein
MVHRRYKKEVSNINYVCSIQINSPLFFFLLLCSLLLSSVLFCSDFFCSVLFCSVLLFSALLSSLLFFYYGIAHTDETVDSSDSAQQSSSSQSVPGSGPGAEQNNIGFIIPKKRTEEPTAIPILSTYCTERTVLNVLY